MLTVNHEKCKIVNVELENYPDVYYMKKWWLEHKFLDEHDNVIEFRGWINTIALSRKDFPENLEGSFWASKIPENGYYNGDIGMKGHFDIGFGENDNFVVGSCYPCYLLENRISNQNSISRAEAELIIKANQPLSSFPYFQARIEDCLVPEKTYIEKIDNTNCYL